MSDFSTEKREAMARKIRALLAKAEDSAATEAEAMSAANKAKELLDKYQLDIGAVGLMEEGFDELRASSETKESARIQKIIGFWVGKYTDTIGLSMGQGRGKPSVGTYFGLKSDVIFAVWLAQSLEKYVLRNSEPFKCFGKDYYKSYRDGVCLGIIDKIQEAIKERDCKKSAGCGTDLVPIDKEAIVSHEANERLNLGGHAHIGVGNIDSFALTQGHKIGEKASLSEPIEQAESVAQIGGPS